jgi:hypothetical protein
MPKDLLNTTALVRVPQTFRTFIELTSETRADFGLVMAALDATGGLADEFWADALPVVGAP